MTAIIAAFISALAAIGVWYLSACDLSRKARENKRRDIRLQFLVDAYRKLESVGNRSIEPKSEHARNIESAIADIQLFGSPRQVRLAADTARSFADTGHTSFDPLLDELRDDLRQELNLDAVPAKRAILRIKDAETPSEGVHVTK